MQLSVLKFHDQIALLSLMITWFLITYMEAAVRLN